MTPLELEQQTARRIDALRRELGDAVAPGRIDAVASFHFDRLVRQATVLDFIPLLVWRYTKEEVLGGEAPAIERAA